MRRDPPPFTSTEQAQAAALQRRCLLLAAAAGCASLPLVTLSQTEAGTEQPLVEVLQVAGAALELQFAPGFETALRAEANDWVRRSALAVSQYFGRFPVERAEVLLRPTSGAGVRSGVTYALPSLLIRITLGRDTNHTEFLADWIMVHEMIHLAIPRVPRAQNWLHEGIATYVEGVARGRAGLNSPEAVWQEWVKGMPQGQPRDGDAGLDHTPTWGRTYWGGAMFCLLADVQIHQRSQGRLGLQDALRGVLAAGGDYASTWPVPRILSTADAAVKQNTLTELHERMKEAPVPVDLDALWQQLGVGPAGLTDDAPLASVRKAILS